MITGGTILSKNLKKAQEINRILMRKLHSVCEKYNITYYYDSGSLLGAVRHKSFIPWDDDVDVAFKRSELEKLIAVPKEEWGEDFELIHSSEMVPGGFLDFVTRLVYLKEEVPVRSYDKAKKKLLPKYKNKIVLDCFILDNAYDNKFMQKLLTLRLTFVFGQAMGHRDYIDYSEYGAAQKAVIFVLSHIGKLRSMDKIYKQYDKISRSVNPNSNHLFYSNYPMPELHKWCEKSWFDGVVPVQVDEDTFNGPSGWDALLTMCYGDYMQLPPKEARVPFHVLPDDVRQ